VRLAAVAIFLGTTTEPLDDFVVVIKPMSLLIADCPRCGAKSITFDVSALVFKHRVYGWQDWYEVFSICRYCHRPTVFSIQQKSPDLKIGGERPTIDAILEYDAALNSFFIVDSCISLRDHVQHQAPEFLDENIANAFKEGAACFSIACYNAAATMFRLCVDLVTRPLLPDPSDKTVEQPNAKRETGP
jgi:hypothetical protein